MVSNAPAGGSGELHRSSPPRSLWGLDLHPDGELVVMASSILLINDSSPVREVLRIALESEGYRVLEAADGREGVALFREHRPAVTIVDIVMPEKEGIETVREILAIDPAAVVFTMSGADDDYQEVARMLGARRGFRKPVRITDMLAAVREVLPAPVPLVVKDFREGYRISVHATGVVIEVTDYHAERLFLDEDALTELLLSLRRPGDGRA
jgi:DNA-binding response OmpR family regulator